MAIAHVGRFTPHIPKQQLTVSIFSLQAPNPAPELVYGLLPIDTSSLLLGALSGFSFFKTKAPEDFPRSKIKTAHNLAVMGTFKRYVFTTGFHFILILG
jgi:hypothetical protein